MIEKCQCLEITAEYRCITIKNTILDFRGLKHVDIFEDICTQYIQFCANVLGTVDV